LEVIILIIALVILLVITAVFPLFIKRVEENIEIFLCIMGISTSIIAGSFTLPNIISIFQNELLGTEGTMIWDCFNLNDRIVSSGIYLAVIEVFSENGGEPITFKKAFVVYSN